MNQVQEFLNKFGSEVRANKEDVKIWCSNEDAQRPPISVDRCQDLGYAKVAETPKADYSSCIYCDVDSEAFWGFLYSDDWNDSVILRVFSGELYHKLDLKLKELLKEETLSKHVTCTYLKMEKDTNKIKFELAPETVRIEFTYYGKNLAKRTKSTRSKLVPNESSIQTLSTSNSESSGLGSYESGICKELRETLKTPYRHDRRDDRIPSPELINVNLAHYHCSNPLDIKDSFESDCDMLEIKLRGTLGLGRNTFGYSETSVNEPWNRGERREKRIQQMQRGAKKKRVRKRPRKGKDGKWEIVEEEDSEDEDYKKILRQRIGQRMGRDLLRKGQTEQQMFSLFEDDTDSIMPVISTNLNLGNMGKILEGEKFSKMVKMNKMKRQKFLMTDERIENINRKLGKKQSEKPVSNKMRKAKSRCIISKSRCMLKRISSLNPNPYEFALLVLGITDSTELFRSIIWMCKDRHCRVGKWQTWFETIFKAKTDFQEIIMTKEPSIKDEKKLDADKLNDGAQGDAMAPKNKPNKKVAGTKKVGEEQASTEEVGEDVAGTKEVGEDKAGTKKVGEEQASTKEVGEDVAGTKEVGEDKAGTKKVGEEKVDEDDDEEGQDDKSTNDEDSVDESSKSATVLNPQGDGDASSDEAKMHKRTTALALQRQIARAEEEEEKEEEGDEEEEYEEEEYKEEKYKEKGEEEEEDELDPLKYGWEIKGNAVPVRMKTEIVIPDFKLDHQHVIRSEMILKAMDDFIIRKERVTSSKDLSFTSLAFIRPSFAHELFQFQ